MEFVEDDIYAYAAAELLYPRSSGSAAATGFKGALARGYRKAWLIAVVVFTLGLQGLTLGLVASARGGGCPGLDIPRWGMDWSNDTLDNMKQINATMIQCQSPNLEQLTTLQTELQAYDPKSQPACVESHKKCNADTCDRISEVHANALDLVTKIMADTKQRQGINIHLAVALAMMAIAISVHRELIRAAVLARIVMSHCGWMPPFFAPLFVRNEQQPGKQLNGIECAMLLLLPLLQMNTCSLAWMAAIKSFVEDADKGQVVTVIINSVAVLFVLELDNYVCTIMKETDALRHNNTAGQPAGVLARRELTLTAWLFIPQNNFGKHCQHWFALIIGCGWLMIPTMTVSALLSAYGIDYWQVSYGVSSQASKTTAYILLGLYLAAVFLLFEPPLLPRGNNCVWRWCHKGCMLVCAGMAMAFLVALARGDVVRGRIFASLAYFLPQVAGLCLFLLWPYFAAEKQRQRVAPQQPPAALARGPQALQPPVSATPSAGVGTEMRGDGAC